MTSTWLTPFTAELRRRSDLRPYVRQPVAGPRGRGAWKWLHGLATRVTSSHRWSDLVVALDTLIVSTWVGETENNLDANLDEALRRRLSAPVVFFAPEEAI
jgi:hypothetical protein